MSQPTKPDEVALMKALLPRGPYNKSYDADLSSWVGAGYLGAEMGMPNNRVSYVLGKWCDKGWYDYGTTLWNGWLTPEGVEDIRRLFG